jgi:WD40 repeat protein
MKKILFFSCLLSIHLGFASQEKSLVKALLIDEKHMFNDLPAEMQTELGSWIVQGHPIVPFLLQEIRNGYPYLDGNGVSFNSIGDKVVTVSSDISSIAKIWDVSSGNCLQVLEGHREPVTSVSFNRAGDKVVTSSTADGNAKIWDVATGRCLNTLSTSDGVCSARFNEQGDMIVTTCKNTITQLWDVATGECLHTLQGCSRDWLFPLESAEFNRAGDTVVTGSEFGSVKIWDVARGSCLHTLRHSSRIFSASFSRQGDTIVTASSDGTAKIWEVVSGKCLNTLQGHSGGVHSASFSSQGDKIVTTSRDGTAKIWDALSGNCLQTLQGPPDTRGLAQFNPAGDKVLTVWEKIIKIWDVSSGTCLFTFPSLKTTITTINSVMFNHTGDKVAFSYLGVTRIFDVKRDRALTSFLKSGLTHKQALLLVALYETVLCRSLVFMHFGLRAVEDTAPVVPIELMKFDLTTYPTLKEAFDTLPPEIQTILRPYVIEIKNTPSGDDNR